MSELERLIESYERAVSAADEEEQRAAAREALTKDFVFAGPGAGEVAGRDNWMEAMRALREQAPGDVRIRRTTAIDEHNGWLRFGWEFVDEAGAVVAAGTDVARLDDEGQRLALVVAFFGELEPL